MDCNWSDHWPNCTASRRHVSQPMVVVSDHGPCTVFCRTAAKHTIEISLALILFLSIIRFRLMASSEDFIGIIITQPFLESEYTFFGGKDSWESHNRPSPPRSTGRMQALILHNLSVLLTLSSRAQRGEAHQHMTEGITAAYCSFLI